DPLRNKVYALGRTDQDPYLQVWEFDGVSWTRHSVSNPLGFDNYGHAAVYFPPTDKIVVFGYPTNNFLGKITYEYSPSTHTWESKDIPGPPARGYQTMVYDSARRVIVLFGGRSASTFDALDDTWEYNGTTWIQRFPPTHPAARMGHQMAYEPTTN